jgi:microcystin-dependent protein
MDAFIGTILPCGFNYAPPDWMLCQGQILQITQYNALYAVLGAVYGGDGRTTFALPDLRGRLPVGMGTNTTTNPPLTTRITGQSGGLEKSAVTGTATGSVTIGVANLPSHTHTATLTLNSLNATTNISVGTGTTGGALVPAAGSTLTGTTGGGAATGAAIYLPAATAQTSPVNLGGVTTTVTAGSGSGVSIGNTGSGTALPVALPLAANVPTMPPFLCINFIICVNGLFPTRN